MNTLQILKEASGIPTNLKRYVILREDDSDVTPGTETTITNAQGQREDVQSMDTGKDGANDKSNNQNKQPDEKDQNQQDNQNDQDQKEDDPNENENVDNNEDNDPFGGGDDDWGNDSGSSDDDSWGSSNQDNGAPQEEDDESKKNRGVLNDAIYLYQNVRTTISKLEEFRHLNIIANKIVIQVKSNLVNLQDLLYTFITVEHQQRTYVNNLYIHNHFVEAYKINVRMLQKISSFTEPQ